MIKFSIKNILLEEVGARLDFNFEEKIDQLGLPAEIEGKSAKGKVTFTKLEESILASADFTAEVVLICDRCLSNFDKTLEISLEREYNINRQAKNEEELYVDKYGDIDLSEAVREDIILAVPMKNLCREGCQGICPNCGVNMNIEKCQCK